MIISKNNWRRIDALFISLLKEKRKKRLNNTDFSIICNNCWGGYIYRRFNINYKTPTVGLYIFPKDYLKLIDNLKYYMDMKITFISLEESIHYDEILKNNHKSCPIGKLGDIEIIFLHYKSKEEAEIKWMRRKKRINYNNLIFKFSEMNGCTNNDLIQFDNFLAKKKICFITNNNKISIKCGIRYKSAKGNQIEDDTSEYGRYINLEKMINSNEVCGNNMK